MHDDPTNNAGEAQPDPLGDSVAVFQSGGWSGRPIGSVGFLDVIDWIRTGALAGKVYLPEALPGADRWRPDKEINRLRAGGDRNLAELTAGYRADLRDSDHPDSVKAAKAHVFPAVAFGWTGGARHRQPVMPPRSAKAAQCLTAFTCYDLDGVVDPRSTADDAMRIPGALAAGVSAGGGGVWVVLLWDRPAEDGREDYERRWWAGAAHLVANELAVEYREGGGADTVPSSCVSLRFLAHDPDVRCNPDADPLNGDGELLPEASESRAKAGHAPAAKGKAKAKPAAAPKPEPGPGAAGRKPTGLKATAAGLAGTSFFKRRLADLRGATSGGYVDAQKRAIVSLTRAGAFDPPNDLADEVNAAVRESGSEGADVGRIDKLIDWAKSQNLPRDPQPGVEPRPGAGAGEEEDDEPLPTSTPVSEIKGDRPARLLSMGKKGGAILTIGEVAILAGEGGVAKSTLTAALAVDFAALPATPGDKKHGRPVLGGLLGVHGGGGEVLLVSHEDIEAVVRDRVHDAELPPPGDDVDAQFGYKKPGAEGDKPKFERGAWKPGPDAESDGGDELEEVREAARGGAHRVHVLDVSNRGPIFGPGGAPVDPEGKRRGVGQRRRALYNAPPGALRMWDALHAEIERRKPRLVVVDPALQAYSGDATSPAPVREFVGALRTLARHFKLGVLLAAHTTKAAKGGAVDPLDPWLVAGSGAWVDGCRGVLAMQYDDSEDAPAGARRISVVKANYGPSRFTARLRMQRRDEDGKPAPEEDTESAILRFDGEAGSWAKLSDGAADAPMTPGAADFEVSRARALKMLRQGRDTDTIAASCSRHNEKDVKALKKLLTEQGGRDAEDPDDQIA